MNHQANLSTFHPSTHASGGWIHCDLLPTQSSLLFFGSKNLAAKRIENRSSLCHFHSNQSSFSHFLFLSPSFPKGLFWQSTHSSHFLGGRSISCPVLCTKERSSRGTSSFGSSCRGTTKKKNVRKFQIMNIN